MEVHKKGEKLMFFDFDALYNETQGDAFNSGKKRYYDDKVKNVITSTVDGKFLVTARVEGERTYTCSITFDEQGGLYDYNCDCDVFSLESGPCKHIVATALCFEEKNPQMSGVGPMKRKTDAGVLSLMQEYNKRKRRKMFTADSAKVDILPYLEMGEDVSLRFTLGAKKQYNLKDISDFVSCVNSYGFRRYGVDLEFYHSPENFTDNGKKLISFISKCYNEKVHGGSAMRFKDELRLFHSDVDEFFALYEGSLVHLGKNDLVLVERFDAVLPVKVIVTSATDGFEVSLSADELRFIEGKDYQYVLLGGRIYRVSEQFANATREFFDTLAIKKKLFVAENDMSAFYNSVLCQLTDYMDVECESVDLSVYEAAPFVCKIYINGNNGSLNLDVKASYDDRPIDLFDDYFSSDFVRDWDSENALRGVLAKYFTHYPDLYIDDEEEIFLFLSEGVKELFGHAEVFIMESMKHMSIRRSPHIHVGVRLSNDLLGLNLTADGYTSEEITAILAAFREKKRYIRLGGGFVNLDDSSIAALSEILDVAKNNDGTFEMPRYYAPFVGLELKKGFFSLTRDSAFRSLLKSLESAENADVEVPDKLKMVMRNYQKTGYRWLKTLKENGFGAILADDMGLGKSLQVIALLLEEKSRAIVVCPTTLMLNWVSEIDKFAPSIKVLVVMGPQEERRAQIEKIGEYDLVITSYDLMRRDCELYEGIEFDYAIADEAQFIKNPETKNAQAVKKINAKHRFALTGTPIENNLGELWSIFDFIMPGYLGTYASFRDKYESDVVRGDDGVAERLKRVVKPFILRRLKADVLTELPAKVESVVEIPLEGEQEKVYQSNLALVRESMRNTPDMNKVVVLSMLTKLRQICCDPTLVYPDFASPSAKTEACIDLVKTAVEGGHKILLFSQFTSMLDIIRRRLMDEGISHYILKGDTPKTERLRLVNKFNENDTKVFLISLKAGGTGINLTGADVVIHYDPWWNESVMNQATDRAYRMGQKKSVQVYKLVAKNSVEEKIMKLQQKKSALSTLVVGKNNDIKEIMEILS